MIKQHNRCATAGFTLTELAVVLGIIGLILGGVWAAANAVMSSSRNNQAIQDISTMAANMRSTFTAAPTFSLAVGDQTAAMITAGIIPHSLVNAAGTAAVNAWGGSIKIMISSPTRFDIVYSNTPRSACVAMASVLSNLVAEGGPIVLITGAGTQTGGGGGLSMSSINTACAQDSTDGVAADTTGFRYSIH